MSFAQHRNHTIWICSVVLFMIGQVQLSADQSGNFTYEVADGKATITDYPDTAAGALVIPSQLGGVPVTHIGEKAFDYCISITSVTIPSTVTTIGRWAFFGCNSLTGVTIPGGVTSMGVGAFGSCSNLTGITAAVGNGNYSSLGGVLFNKAQTILIQYPSGKTGGYLVPSTVDNIGEEAFNNCSSLTSVTIPSGVTSIGKNAFFSCGGLTSVAIPSSVTSIGDFAFGFCSNLTEITVAAGNSNYSSLDGVLFNETQATLIQYPSGKTGWYTIPSTVDSIRGFAFSACIDLTGINIPDSVTSIGSGAFFNSSSLGSSVTIPSGVTSIASNTFYNCTNLPYVYIPSGVTTIGANAFYNCSSLTGVQIPSVVSSIGSGAFSGCSNLTSVILPSGVASIGDDAFLNCSSLTSTYFLGNAPASFGSGVFNLVAPSHVVYYLNTSTGFASPTWNGYNAESIDFPFTYEIVGGGVTITDYPESAGGVVIIPDTIDGKPVTGIGPLAFNDCSNLTSVTIPSSVTTISRYAFAGCSSLTSVNIPSVVTTIEDGTFQDCSSLISVAIPGGVTSIGQEAFRRCSSLTSVTIPSGVATIDWFVFSGCSSLTSVTISSGVTTISLHAFSYCTSLTSVNIPSSVTIISDGAFNGCSSLTHVNIPSGVTSIDGNVFGWCTSLTSVTIPSGVTSIGSSAFGNCTSLTSIMIPSGVASIGWGAFQSCSSLTSITIPSSVTSISPSVFSYCSSLTSTYFIGNAPATFGSDVFQGVAAGHLIYYFDTSTGFISPTWNGYATQMIDTAAYPFAGWLLESNISYDTNLNQDLNGDGVTLLMAYAMNLNPNEHLTGHLPGVELNSTTLSLKYYGGSTGVTYRVEASKDLDSWVTTDVTLSAPDGNGVLTASIPRDEVCGFLRLVVVED